MMLSESRMALVFAAYFLGSVPFGFLVSRFLVGLDIRTRGSGNIGATNVGRVLGRKWGVSVFVLDVLKGFLPALLGARLFGMTTGAAAGLAAVVGHNWSFFLSFRGGKGVATSCGIFLALFPQGTGIAIVVWAATLAAWRYVSLSSLLAAAALFLSALLLQNRPFSEGRVLTILTALAAVLTLIRHRTNIARLLDGTERQVGPKRKAVP